MVPVEVFDEARKYVLPNGLKILVLPYKRADVSAVIHWVNVGYFCENDREIGISHFLEHMFFKGSKTRKMEDISNDIKKLGGYINAGTIYDHTYYYTVLPSKSTEKGIDIISDLILNPDFPQKEIKNEKSVVIEEIKKKLDSPAQLGFERLVEMAFDKHRIRRFRMGYEKDIKRITKNSVENYCSDFYRPNNSIVTVVGNFDADEIVQKIENFYKGWGKKELKKRTAPQEPLQKYPKKRKISADILQSYLKIGFHVPNIHDDEFFTVSFAAAILGRGRSSRLYRVLKEETGLVDDISTSVYADGEVGYFIIEAVLKEKDFDKAKRRILLELKNMKESFVDLEEIIKVRNIIETNYFADKEDVLGQAYNLCYFESLGDFKKSKDFLKKSLSVDPVSIVRAAKKYFDISNLSLLEYKKGKRAESRSKGFAMSQSEAKKLKKYLDSGSKFKLSLKEKIGPVEEFGFERPQRYQRSKPRIRVIPGSCTIITKKNPGVPLLSTALYIPGGRLDESEKNCGITNLTLKSALKGTKSMNADKIAKRLESLGCSLRGEATADNFGYAFSVLSKNFKEAYSIISDVLVNPVFESSEIEKEKTSMRAAVLARKDDMFRYPIDLCYRSLFGIHPYGLPRYGTEKSIVSIKPDEIRKWHENYFDISKMVICSAGEIPDDIKDTILSPFEDKKKRKTSSAQILPLSLKRGIKQTVETRRRNQSAFAVGFRTQGVASGDFYALEVLQNILAGMGGRLYMEVREKMGLAYTVTAFNISLMRTGAFVVYAATSPSNEKKARDIVLKEIKRIKKAKLPKDELEMAKNYTIGTNSISMQSNLAQAYENLRYYFIKGDVEEVDKFASKIRQVTDDDIKKVLDKYFSIENYAIGIVRGK